MGMLKAIPAHLYYISVHIGDNVDGVEWSWKVRRKGPTFPANLRM